MNIFKLVLKEITNRKLNFLLGLLSIIAVAAVASGSYTSVKAHDLKTAQLISHKKEEVEARIRDRVKEVDLRVKMRTEKVNTRVQKRTKEVQTRVNKLEDEYRKITLKLGYNLLIQPEGQEVNILSDKFGYKLMPEEYVHRLAVKQGMIIRHLLPMLVRKVYWPEEKRDIILNGIRDEVPLTHLNPKKPLIDRIPKGKVWLGYKLSTNLGLKVGDKIKFHGKVFTVDRCNPRVRSHTENMTLWMHLDQAQELFGLKDKINMIKAIKCHCDESDLAHILKNVRAELPDTEVVENTQAIKVRAEARDTARAEAIEALRSERLKAQSDLALEKEKATADITSVQQKAKADLAAVTDTQLQLKHELKHLQAVLIPAVVIISLILIAALFFVNVNDRRHEIGILRTIGVGAHFILTAFLLKAFFMGIIGAIIGLIFGVLAGIGFHLSTFTAELISPQVVLIILLGTPILATIASWLPALSAAQHDPAEVLREE